MEKSVLKWFILLASSMFLVGTAQADSALELLKDIEVHGFATSSYTYNFDQPSDSSNRFRVYDFDDNSFKFDNGELVLKKDASSTGDIGFRVDLTYGFSGPQANKASGGPNVGGTDVSDDDFDVQIGFVSYVAPVGSGLQIDFGKFATHVGAEVMDGYDGWNYTFSRSFAFNFGPFTHTGLRLGYTVSNKVSLLGILSNGKDNQTDDNDAKGFGAQIALAPMDRLAIYLNYFGSPESQTGDTNNSDDYQNFYDIVCDFQINEKTFLNGNFVYGSEDNALGAGLDANWWGTSWILRNDLNDWFSVNLRYEHFDDEDGFRSGTIQKLNAITVTPEMRVNSNMVIRAEYRHDDSDATPFIDDSGAAQDDQDTVAFNMLFYF
tara:strand:- start:6234 stop:7367 length:1134 start_codon:yes stop_codon:yes gene_type:complete